MLREPRVNFSPFTREVDGPVGVVSTALLQAENGLV